MEAGGPDAADVCLTFDDGLLSQYDVARPVLERHGLTAFWFVYSAVFEGEVAKFEVYRAFRCRFFPDVEAFYAIFFRSVRRELGIEPHDAVPANDIARHRTAYPFYSADDVRFRMLRDRVLTDAQYEHVMDDLIRARGLALTDLATDLWMTNDHLHALSGHGHVIGLHSYSHPMVLGELPRERQRDEYHRNARHLERVCGTAPVAVAHPANSYSDDTIEILKGLGVRCGFRANMAPRRHGAALNATPFELARDDQANIMSSLRNAGRNG
jgi:peptidoglycan/xylan/chitin deacetylase (PgdA/CDA1 family)